uniref:BIG2 domain-containing protein n=1 Tax=Oryza glumipatula TaxID=40148 RepID=A0A0E0B6Q7_9ORYZ
MASPSAAAAVAAAVVMMVAAAALCFSAAAAASPVGGPHMADLSVLLPPRMTKPVEHRLIGVDGCFTWAWDHHDIISVKPEYNDSSRCSTSARLASIAPYSGRKETSVYATDIISGITIHCKVFVDRISRIRIFHHAVKIDLDEVATLRVHAFDDEDNVFSSLVGLQFLWQLTPRWVDTNSHHLVHIPLKETHLSDCSGFCGDMNIRFELEDRNLGSDLFVVKGIEIGQEVVNAQLFEPQFEHVNDTITLTVAEAMSLEPPSPVLVTVGAMVKFKLKHHHWHVTNSSVAQVDSSLGVLHALSLGFTNIVVEDTRVSGHAQVSSLHVVIPQALFLYLVPVVDDSAHFHGITSIPSSEVWYVFPGRKYVVLAKAFAEGFDFKEMFITEENELKLASSTVEFWNLSQVPDSSAGSYDVQTSRLLTPISKGKGYLDASLTYRTEASGPAKVLKLQQEVNVCSKVKAIWDEEMDNSRTIYLPWVPGAYQEVELKAVGGCGKMPEDYKLSSSDESVASVSDSLIVRTKRPGRAVIKVVSVFDALNFDEVTVEVSTPSAQAILPNFPVEVPVGTQLQAAVTLKTSNGHPFSRCNCLNAFIRWSLLSENESFEVVGTADALSTETLKHYAGSWAQYGNPCAWVSLNASAAGQATLAATFSFDSESYSEIFSGPIFLKSTSKISAYYPLVVLQAGSGNRFGGYWVDLSRIHSGIQNMVNNSPKELYLVPGSTMDVLLSGGPEQWDQLVDFVETVDVIGESKNYVVSSTAVQKLSSRLYRVSCPSKGNFKLLFSRGNMIGKDHPEPAVSQSELAVVCDFPSAITLIANENESRLVILEAASRAERKHNRLQASPVVISNGRNMRLAAAGVHGNGRFFANSSSLCLSWEVTECEGLAYLDEDKDMLDDSSWERFLVLQNSTGMCTVRATVIGFSSRVDGRTREEEHMFLQSARDTLTDAIQLQIVSSLRVTPDYVLIVFHPEAQKTLAVSGGTCFLDASSNDTQVVQILQHPGKALCSQLILGARGLGTATVTIQDIGLSPRALTDSLVRVANVDWIKINSEEHISLMEGSTEDFHISAGTQDGQVFRDSQYKYMGIEVHLGDETLELINSHELLDGPKFSVKAAKIGTTSLYVTAKQYSGQRVLSQVVKVEVYKPLQIHPEYIYLTPGASFVLSVKGGPKVGVVIEYTSLNVETVEVQNSTGKLSAKTVGNSTMRAVAFSNEGTFICEAFGRVEVDIPVAMILSTQSDRLCVGCSMPIYPSLPKYGLDQGLYSEGKNYPWFSNGSSNAFINHVIGRSAGKTKISVSITCDFLMTGSSGSIAYSASKTILVVPDPPLALGLPITWLFPPFYTTTDLLPRLVDSDSDDLESTIGYSLLRNIGKSDLVLQNANIIDGSKIRTGESNAIDCIQAKDLSTGRTEIASCLRVAEVAQAQIAAAESSIHIAYLSVHDKVELDIKYSDELGYTFSEALGIVPVKIETNHPDVVSILMPKEGNGTHGTHERFVLQARSHGTALVRLQISHIPKKADFIMVSVGAQMYPRDVVLRSGQQLNFTIIGDRMDVRGSSQWLSSNEKVVHINRITGEAQARGEGIAEVIFKGPNTKLHTTVTVLKVNQIVVNAPAETLTNAAGPPGGYKFSVKLRSDSTGHSADSSINHINVPFDCKVEPSFVGYVSHHRLVIQLAFPLDYYRDALKSHSPFSLRFVEPWSDDAAKKSYCLFHPYSPAQLLPVKLNPKEGFLHIVVHANLKEDPKVTGSAHALFVKGFYIKEPRKLNLTPSCNHSIITIGGNTDVELFWNAKDLLSASRVDTNGRGVPSQISYQVEALKRQSFYDKITIILPATGQSEEIEVIYDTGERRETSTSGLTTLAAIVTCIVVPIATIALFMKLLEKKPIREAPPRHATPAPASAPAAAMTDPASPATGELSPRTPQPFMEYVRRTIDDTPYYKRDARRRFNPQNTY